MTEITIHGSLVVVYGLGVLLIGEAGTGKSDCVLGLIERGHRFVADDAVTIRSVRGKAVGKSAEGLSGSLHVRGAGIIDVTKVFGVQALLSEANIECVVELVVEGDSEREPAASSLLGVEIRKFVIPYAQNRNLPLIVELLVREAGK